MLEFVVLGTIPGTNIQLSYSTLLIIVLALCLLFLAYMLIKRLWHHTVQAALQLMQYQLISL